MFNTEALFDQAYSMMLDDLADPDIDFNNKLQAHQTYGQIHSYIGNNEEWMKEGESDIIVAFVSDLMETDIARKFQVIYYADVFAMMHDEMISEEKWIEYSVDDYRNLKRNYIDKKFNEDELTEWLKEQVERTFTSIYTGFINDW